jgi:putrescine importer
MSEDVTSTLDGTVKPKLRPVLSLWDLVFYGIVLIQPVAAIPLFGIANKLSEGHVVSTIGIAMVAMMITAVSYGRMATVYPEAGSAYTYVGQTMNASLGFLTGWVMLLDYLVIPIINIIYGSLTLARLAPAVPFALWVAVLTVFITLCNLWGVRSTARANATLLFVMCLAVVIFMLMAVWYLWRSQGLPSLFSTSPFYTPGTTHVGSLLTATSLAALTYIGFDGVTVLAEEVKDPKKNVLRATVLVCLFTGIISGLQVYLAQRVWPDYKSFPSIETAFMDVCSRVGGSGLFQIMAVTMILASIGSGLSGQAGAARLLFGMGRDNVLPVRFFGELSRKNAVPAYNILLIGILTLVGSLLLDFERAAELLNFGAFLAFMGVNLAVIRQFYLGREMALPRRVARDLLLPMCGFLFCLTIWWQLPRAAKIVGGFWLAAGVVYLAIMTRGFKAKATEIRFEA